LKKAIANLRFRKNHRKTEKYIGMIVQVAKNASAEFRRLMKK